MSAGRTAIGKSLNWGTPKKYVEAITSFFGGRIYLDPCSNLYSIVNAEVEYSLPFNDGLKESWDYPTIFVNPPYGVDKARGTLIKQWLSRCEESHREHNSEVIALVPVATNTGHWKSSVYGKATALCLLHDTRLKFLENGKEGGKGAPMACCLIYWGKRLHEFVSHFESYGPVVRVVVPGESP